jgi:23S rRNA pseudouridine1911/1915/1917 synthase
MFKTVPKKYHPKGLTILFEDMDILVVDKIEGLLTIASEGEKLKTAHYLLNEYVKKGNAKSKNRVFIVHRLDRDTSGILVFAKNEKAKIYLQENWASFDKKYFALVEGQLARKQGEISSYLLENKVLKVYSVKDAEQGKFAKTVYKVIQESKKYSLLEVQLLTGRKHQIRVHFSENGNPVAGDKLYGNSDKNIKRLTLHSAYLSITHPFSKKPMTFECKIPPYFKSLLNV